MNKSIVILSLIVLMATVLRFWQLGTVPPSPDWDEVALGYNAYSIIETGKDEYGESYPFVIRSFDDYKPALYMYLVIPFVKLLGLTVFAVRLPSAIFGVLAVVATYFLVKEIFHNLKNKEHLALLSSFLLAISPWHLQFSRIGFEANVGLAFNIFGALFFIKGLKKPWLLIISALFAGLSLHVYQSEKVFTPLLFLILVIMYWKEFLKVHKKFVVAAVLLGLTISLPLAHYILTNKEALSRAAGVSVFSNQTEFLKNNVEEVALDKERGDILGVVLDNRRFVYAKSIAAGYLSHFDLNWLFLQGDIARHHAPNMALLYLWELPFLLIGIYFLIYGSFDRRSKIVIFAWLLIAPIPASITSGVPHAIRTLNFLPMFQILVAIGIIYTISNFKLKYLLLTCYLLFVTFNIVYYLNQYFVQQNYLFSKDWQYGYEQTITEVKSIEGKYDKIIVSNTPHMDQSYMFFLFYLKYPPALYQSEAQGASGGFKENHEFGKYEFRPIDWNKEEKKPRTLFVGRPDDFSKPFEGHIKTINFLDGEPAIILTEGK